MTAGERSVELADGRRRFFIVTAGRTGSSLLATILAEAGADFGMPPQEQWDVARGGSMEHEEIRRASHHFLRAFDRSPVKPPGALSKLIWSYHRDAGKRHLKRALAGATYFKALNLDLAIPFAIKLGYFPQVIVNYRPFEEQVVSLSQMLISWSAATLAAAHNRTYQNALLLVHSYGGCVVSYADLTDRRRTEWAASLAAITGLPAEKLLAGRDRRTSAKETAGESIPVLDDTAHRTFLAIDQLSGRTLSPSPQAMRNWKRRNADRPASPIEPASRQAQQGHGRGGAQHGHHARSGERLLKP